MDGITVGVFGTEKETKDKFASSIAKKSEAEGITVYHRTEGGRRYSFLDTSDFPERVQGYARIASIVDHALYLFPTSGKLTAADGELAVLLGCFGISGTLQLLDGSASPESAREALRGTVVANYPIEERSSSSAAIDLSKAQARVDFQSKGTLVYIDRAFTVKGVGTVALGFIISGRVSLHDQLRLIPGPPGLRADVRGIQVNDIDFQDAGRGIRVGLSLRGVDAEVLQKSHWLDDGSFTVSERLTLSLQKSPFYKSEVESRDLHVQLAGEMVAARLSTGENGLSDTVLSWQVPAWEGLKAAVLDLNGRNLRAAAGATCKF
ncbi:MAG: hypothetical protein OK404_03390 [Thaumarchaeota archaeon]|nr:hypothetical protein [Nitrososphaerota archaeon]